MENEKGFNKPTDELLSSAAEEIDAMIDELNVIKSKSRKSYASMGADLNRFRDNLGVHFRKIKGH